MKLCEMLNCLKPVRLAVETLMNHDAKLLTRDGIFIIFFSNLEKQKSALSRMLLKGIRNELLKRGNTDLISLIKYLSNVSCLYGVEKSIFLLR
jgi:hypothetical protein